MKYLAGPTRSRNHVRPHGHDLGSPVRCLAKGCKLVRLRYATNLSRRPSRGDCATLRPFVPECYTEGQGDAGSAAADNVDLARAEKIACENFSTIAKLPLGDRIPGQKKTN